MFNMYTEKKSGAKMAPPLEPFYGTYWLSSTRFFKTWLLRRKECPFEKRVPFVAIVPQGHRFGSLFSLNVILSLYSLNLNSVSPCMMLSELDHLASLCVWFKGQKANSTKHYRVLCKHSECHLTIGTTLCFYSQTVCARSRSGHFAVM